MLEGLGSKTATAEGCSVGVNDNIGSFNASKLVAGGTWAPTR